MTWIKKQSDDSFQSYNFIAPDGPSASEDVLFPLGEVQSPEYAATLAVTIKQMVTFLQPEEITGAMTINLTINEQLTKGALLIMKLAADDQGAKTVTLGTGFDSDAGSVVVPNDGFIFLACAFDGTSFVPCAPDDVELAALAIDVGEAESDIDDLEEAVDVLEGSELLEPTYAGTIAVTIEKKETFVQPAELTGSPTLNLTLDGDLPVGAKLHLKLTADDQGAKTVTLGTGFSDALASVVVDTSTTACVSFVFDGTEFLPMWNIPT
jgi:hypothetical protein